MLTELIESNRKIISIMKSQEGVLGSWYFGSVSHKMTDEYSDIDIVFLVDNCVFEDLGRDITKIIASAVDKVILCWAENINNEKIVNFDLLLMFHGEVFQYDIFLLNKEYIDDFMCKLHYINLRSENVIFDLQGEVKKLLDNVPTGSLWSEDVSRLIDTYWLHVQITVKYFLRKDYFKLEGILRILMDTHASLLLTGFDKIKWGGSASKLHFISAEKQQHLMKYGCMEDFAHVRNNLLQSISWFEEDIEEIGTSTEQQHSCELGKIIKPYWIQNTEKMFDNQ